MALFQHWQNSANTRIKKQPIIYLVVEVFVVIALILFLSMQGCNGYQKLVQTSESNINTTNDIYESVL